MRVDYRIECKAALPVTEGLPSVIRSAAVLIRGNKIEWLGPVDDVPSDYVPTETLVLKDKVAMPGLVNAHTHAAMVLMRGFGDDLALQEWLTKKIFPTENGLTGDDVYWGTMLACIEMAKSGCTSFADMYFFMEEAAQAVADSGMRAALARSVSSITDADGAKLKASVEFARRWNGVADGRITAKLSPHSLYTCSPDYVKDLICMAKTEGLAIHTHLAETKREEDYAIVNFGTTTATKMAQIGLFDVKALVAHCVWLTDGDMDILAEKGVVVAHNPGSNTKLASGIARVTEMRRKGITVGLGTDGAASNNNLDMMEEMRLATLLAKVSTLEPTALPAAEALRMATADGALAIEPSGSLGRLAAGCKADIAFVDTRGAHMCPEHDIISNIVYSAQAADVDTVFVDGKPVVCGRRMITVDEDEVKRQVAMRARRLVEKRPV